MYLSLRGVAHHDVEIDCPIPAKYGIQKRLRLNKKRVTLADARKVCQEFVRFNDGRIALINTALQRAVYSGIW